jgi:amino-acid N-acetyltransferase
MNKTKFINWFRQASPYIHAHNGHTFVICFDGESVYHNLYNLVHDIALLSSLGIKLVLIHGAYKQIESYLHDLNIKSKCINGNRITDNITLNHIKHIYGQVNHDIQALLSMGLTNSPLYKTKIRVATGNFITAKPLGIINGVDFGYAGKVRNIDTENINYQLNNGHIVLISPLGYSPTGEVFNLMIEEVSTAIAINLHADKLIYLSTNNKICDKKGNLLKQLTLVEVSKLLKKQKNPKIQQQLRYATKACKHGVQRTHLINYYDGALLLELFTRDGIGTLISKDKFENMRRAIIDDIGGILELIKPLEKAGILVRHSREKLETDINNFIIQERDKTIIACAALYPFNDENMAEMACLVVHQDYRHDGYGDALLKFIENETHKLKIKNLFVLTTHTAHWFQERGFVSAKLNFLPQQRCYNYKRNSKLFIKDLTDKFE